MKGCMGSNGIRGDRRGFTLVELVVGVTILAILISPLLHSFVTSARTAAKARAMNDATLAAQDVVEVIKAMGIDEVLAEIQGDDNKFETMGVDVELYASTWDEDAEHYTYTLVTGASEIAEAKKPGLATYCLGLYGVGKIAAGDDPDYDMMVRLDAGVYQKEAETDPDKYNDTFVARFSAMDGIYQQYPLQDKQAAEDFDKAAKEAAAGGDEEDLAAIFPDAANYITTMNRVITINIEAGGANKAKVKHEYEYTAAGLAPNSWTDDTCTVTFSDSAEQTPNVYFFYYPHYCGWEYDDRIVIKNSSNQKVNVFLVQQKRPAEYDGLPIDFYDPELKVFNTASSVTGIYSNIAHNFVGAELSSYKYNLYENWNPGDTPLAPSLQPSPQPLVETGKQNRVYHMEAELYKIRSDSDRFAPGDLILTYDTTRLH